MMCLTAAVTGGATLTAATASRPNGSVVSSFVIGGPPSGLSGAYSCDVTRAGRSSTLYCMGTRATARAERRCQRQFITAIGDVTLRRSGRARFGTTCTGQAPAGQVRLDAGETWVSPGFRCALSRSGRALTCRGSSGEGFRIDTAKDRAIRLARVRPVVTLACPDAERRPASCTVYGLPSALSPSGRYELSDIRWQGWGLILALGSGSLRSSDGSLVPVAISADELVAGRILSRYYSRIRLTAVPGGESVTLGLDEYTESS